MIISEEQNSFPIFHFGMDEVNWSMLFLARCRFYDKWQEFRRTTPKTPNQLRGYCLNEFSNSNVISIWTTPAQLLEWKFHVSWTHLTSSYEFQQCIMIHDFSSFLKQLTFSSSNLLEKPSLLKNLGCKEKLDQLGKLSWSLKNKSTNPDNLK